MLACVAATFLTPALLHAYDNEAQIRARQALEDKMKELDTQQSTNSAPPPMATQPKPTPTKANKQKPAKSPKSANPTTPAPEAQKPTPSEIIVTPGQPPQEVPPPQTAPEVQKPAATAPPVVSQPAPVVSAPASAQPAQAGTPGYSTPPATSSANTEETEKLRESMRSQMMQQQKAQSGAGNAQSQTNQPWAAPFNPPQSQEKHAASPQKHVARSSQPSTQPAPTLPPLAAPPTGLSAAKQQKLDQLLQLYRSDQITPQEYHEQRAKILAGP